MSAVQPSAHPRARGGIALVGALLAASFGPVEVAAQSQLDAGDADGFMGNWELPLMTDMGAFDMALVIEDQGGKVAATFGTADLGMQEVTDITRDGERLVLDYDVNFEGQYFPVRLTLEREGEGLAYHIDAADGQFSASGKGTRAG
jgi:hypothetical protein